MSGQEALADAVTRLQDLPAKERVKLLANPFGEESHKALRAALGTLLPTCAYSRLKALIIAHHSKGDNFASLEERLSAKENSLSFQALRLGSLRQGGTEQHCTSWKWDDAKAWEEMERHSPSKTQVTDSSRRQELLSRVNLLQDRSMLRGLWIAMGLPDPSASDTGYQPCPITKEQLSQLLDRKVECSATAALHPLGILVRVAKEDWHAVARSETEKTTNGLNFSSPQCLKNARINLIKVEVTKPSEQDLRRERGTEAHELGHTLHATHTRVVPRWSETKARVIELAGKPEAALQKAEAATELKLLLIKLVRALQDMAQEETTNEMSSKGKITPAGEFESYVQRYCSSIGEVIDALALSKLPKELIDEATDSLTSASIALRESWGSYLAATQVVAERPDSADFKQLAAIAELVPLHAPHRLSLAVPQEARPQASEFKAAIQNEREQRQRALALLEEAYGVSRGAFIRVGKTDDENLAKAREVGCSLIAALGRECPRLLRTLTAQVPALKLLSRDSNAPLPPEFKESLSAGLAAVLTQQFGTSRILDQALTTRHFSRCMETRPKNLGNTLPAYKTWQLETCGRQFKASEARALLPRVLKERARIYAAPDFSWKNNSHDQALRALSGAALACFERATGMVPDGKVVAYCKTQVEAGNLESLRSAMKLYPLTKRNTLLDAASKHFNELRDPKDVPLLARFCFFGYEGQTRDAATSCLVQLLQDSSVRAQVSIETLMTLTEMGAELKDPRVSPSHQFEWIDSVQNIQSLCREEIFRRGKPST
jgi:hypothetical protein